MSSNQIRFTLTKILGSGSQGPSYLAQRTDKATPLIVVVKKLPLATAEEDQKKQADELKQKLPALLELKQANVILHLGGQLCPSTKLTELTTYDIIMEY